ncbi:hypothetical protein SAMN05444401_3854 [Clostridium amylolyticum]|uniref:Uncharacterized protein n=1 Tax=Clostridium amylolyticum TaxID=1121298 RepID=A0A1M6M693_9CLOT|nr:hypothetical protein [Clostridium amylolyticum]SHJ78995.1 hypothetical protein SAMN05444401_3854 [Clostridium amylolyticum]
MGKVENGEVILIRCVISGEKESYYKAKDYQGKKYLIEKNKDFKKVSVGDDRAFYAYKKEMGKLIKTTTLFPVSHEEYIKHNNTGISGKTLEELGITLDNLHE